MQIVPYLNFNGNCEEAFTFYEKCLRGKIVGMFQYGDTPAAGHMSEDLQKKVMHVRLEAEGAVLMGSDCPPEMFEGTKGTSVSLHVKETVEAERIFAELSEGGIVTIQSRRPSGH
jgi:PhnB protein